MLKKYTNEAENCFRVFQRMFRFHFRMGFRSRQANYDCWFWMLSVQRFMKLLLHARLMFLSEQW